MPCSWKFGWETIIFESKIYLVFAHTYIKLSAAGSPVKYFLSTAMTGKGDWPQGTRGTWKLKESGGVAYKCLILIKWNHEAGFQRALFQRPVNELNSFSMPITWNPSFYSSLLLASHVNTINYFCSSSYRTKQTQSWTRFHLQMEDYW